MMKLASRAKKTDLASTLQCEIKQAFKATYHSIPQAKKENNFLYDATNDQRKQIIRTDGIDSVPVSILASHKLMQAPHVAAM